MTTRLTTTIISLIGAPGSGKGTYGSMLASRIPNSTFLSVGDILREHSEQNANNAVGQAMKETLRSGALADVSFVSEAVLQRLKHASHQNNLVILDGFPRSREQAEIVSTWPIELQRVAALHFNVPDEICISKLLGRRKCSICNGSFNVNGVNDNGFFMPPILPSDGSCPKQCNHETDWKKREDDTEETIRKRMKVYHDETEPVLSYWSERDRLHAIVPYNGVKDIDKMVNAVDKILTDIQQYKK
eukprot:CCRYP_016726-RA/>CCRYP_016726-RA protein AED:0.14 eAED:0.14 QI:0/-1/0/1/-1/1/1/0/244